MFQTQVRIHLFQAAILFFQFLHPPHFTNAHPTIFGFPFVEGSFAEPILAAEIFHRHSRFGFLQDIHNLGPILTWVFWLLEFGIIFWVARSIAKQEIQVPVCEVCGSRLGKEKHLGGTTPSNESRLLDLIHSKQFVELGKMIEKNEVLPSTELYMQRCEACEKGNSYIMICRASRNPRGGLQLTNVQNVMLEPRDSVLFSQELKFNN